MKWFRVGALIAVLAIANSGCSKSRPTSERWRDRSDRDFVTTISATSESLVFLVEVKRVNRSVDKKISGLPITVDFVLTDHGGHVFTARDIYSQQYAREVGDVFGRMRSTDGAVSLTSRLRLMTRGLKPGIYTIRPRVRIAEIGKDALSGAQPGDFTVAVPAGNSVKITIK